MPMRIPSITGLGTVWCYVLAIRVGYISSVLYFLSPVIPTMMKIARSAVAPLPAIEIYTQHQKVEQMGR